MIRLTAEPTPHSPEQLLFSAEEAHLSVRSLTHYVVTELQTEEDNRGLQTFNVLTATPEGSMQTIGRTHRFVTLYATLAGKFADVLARPEDPTRLLPAEIEALGYSLYRVGATDAGRALEAMTRIDFFSKADEKGADAYLRQTADDAYALFKELEPIGQSKANVSWMRWSKDQAAS